MDFDFSTETITPDTTNILTIGGTGGMEVPRGTSAERPVSGLDNGALRYNTDLNILEGYVNSSWYTVTTAGTGTTLTLSGDVTGTGTTTAVTTTLATVNANVGTFAATTVNAKGLVTAASALSGDATSSGAVLTLATVNASPQTDTFRKITVNAKGLVTATSAVGSADITTALGYTPVNRAGDTMSGTLNMGSNLISNLGTPVAGTDATTKNYVDAAIAGLSWKQAVRAATTTNGALATAYENGDTIDGVTLATNDRILIKNQTTQTENGIYIVQASGAPVRSEDANTGAELVGATVFVDQGTANANTGWTQTTDAPITIGSSNIVFVQFSGSGSYTAGTGLTLSGNQFSLTSPVVATLGGTGTTTAPSAGQFLYSSGGTTYAPTTLSSQAVTTFSAGTTGLTPNSATSGAITLAGTLVAVNGGTGQSSYAVGDILYASTTTALSKLAGVATGNALISGGVNTAPSWGKIGLTTHVSGILPVANGGTALSSTPANGQLLIGNGTGYTLAGLTAGAGISVTPGAGTITVTNSGVTSITFGSTGLTPNTATNGAVSVAGTLVLANGGTSASLTAVNGGIVYSTGSAMAISAAGTSGQYLQSNGAAAPTWVTPSSALQLYKENPSTPTAPSATGTNAVAIMSGSAASATNAIAIGAGTAANVNNIFAYANGNFATAGDAQDIKVVLRNITTNNTTTELFVDGSAQRLVLPNNSAWTFTLRVVARRTDATGGWAMYAFTGGITRDGTAATTNLQSSSRTIIDESTGSLNCTISADTTNGSLNINVTGSTSQTFRWVATAEITQVTN